MLNFNFQEFSEPNSFFRTFQVLKFLEKNPGLPDSVFEIWPESDVAGIRIV